jgi:hypothetical protein
MKRLPFFVFGLLICSSVFGQSVAIPVITPVPGSYPNSVSVTITDATPGAKIYYTTDGTVPTVNSKWYTGPFTLTANATVQAMAALANSGVAMSAFAVTTCLTSGTAWKSATFPTPQTGNFQIDFDATPSAVAMDSVVGVSSAAATAYGQLSMGVRFSTSSNIDAISGTGYTPTQAISYVVGHKYHFTLTVTGGTYSASVDGKVIGSNLPFRAAATTLGQLSYVAEVGSVSICNLKVSVFSPPAVVPIVVVTTSLPAAKYGIAYSTILTAGGGKAPYSWTATGLPAGMALSASGILSGTPTLTGNFNVTATDALAAKVSENLTLSVSPKPVHQVLLSWVAPTLSTGVTGYNVYRAGVKLPGNPVSVTTFTDLSVTAGANYCYIVTSVGGTITSPLESGPSSQVCATVPVP